MTQHAHTDQVTDEYSRPVPGATIYVTDTLTGLDAQLTSNGSTPLTQPVVADQFGIYTYWANDGVYIEAIHYGGKLREKGIAILGVPPQTKGDPGAGSGGYGVGLLDGTSGIAIANGIDLVKTTGASAEGSGAAEYIADAAVNSAWLTAHPRAGFISSNSRGFRIVSEEKFTPQKFYQATDPDYFNAMRRALDYMKSLAPAGTGADYPGAGNLFVPRGKYISGQAIEIFCSSNISGESDGSNGGAATAFSFPNSTGFIGHSSNTTGSTSTRTPDGYSGDGSALEKLFILGAFSSAESEKHGIHARGKMTVRDCYVNLFAGDGFYCNVSSGSGGATEGNCNNLLLERCTFAGCRNGMFIQGADANAGSLKMMNLFANRRWGGYFNSFLGNGHSDHHAASNGAVNVGGSIPYTQVSYSGNIYSLVVGGNPAIAPSGTTAHTANWYYARAGGVTAITPAWTNTLSVRDGGPYFTSSSPILSSYSETGQGVSQVTNTGYIDGARQYAGVAGPGMYARLIPPAGLRPSLGLSGGLRIEGDNAFMNGPAGLELLMSGGVGYLQALDRDGGNVFKQMILNAAILTLQYQGATKVQIDADGINMAAGAIFKKGGSQEAAVADPSGGTTVDTQARTALTTLLSRLRDLGIIHT